MPCLVKADGTIIAPIAETWKIRNDSPQPVTLDTAVADTITPGTSITAKSQPTTLYEDDTQDGKGNYTISINDTRNETRAEGGTDEHPVQIVLGGGIARIRLGRATADTSIQLRSTATDYRRQHIDDVQDDTEDGIRRVLGYG